LALASGALAYGGQQEGGEERQDLVHGGILEANGVADAQAVTAL
jgi:hypothetical protein